MTTAAAIKRFEPGDMFVLRFNHTQMMELLIRLRTTPHSRPALEFIEPNKRWVDRETGLIEVVQLYMHTSIEIHERPLMYIRYHGTVKTFEQEPTKIHEVLLGERLLWISDYHLKHYYKRKAI